MKHEDLVRRLRELTHTKTGRAVKPPDGTQWVYCLPEMRYGDYAMRDGVLMVEYRNGRKTRRADIAVAELRCRHDLFTEIPPPARDTHAMRRRAAEAVLDGRLKGTIKEQAAPRKTDRGISGLVTVRISKADYAAFLADPKKGTP